MKGQNHTEEKQPEESRFQINPSQWERIKKRKVQREAYEKKHDIKRCRVKTMHITRQEHAKKRPRGIGEWSFLFYNTYGRVFRWEVFNQTRDTTETIGINTK